MPARVGFPVILRKRRFDEAFRARLDPLELLFEAGQERTRAEDQLDIGAGAAFESFAADLADEIDRDLVALRRAALLRGEGPVSLEEPVERLGDRILADLGREALDFDVFETADLEFRQHFEIDDEGEIALGGESLLQFRLIFGKLDLRFAGEAQAIVVDDLAIGLVDGILDDIGHHAASIDALEMADRHLARAKAVDADFPLEVGELLVEALGEFGRREHHFEFAPEPLRLGFRHLHHHRLFKTSNTTRGRLARGGCKSRRNAMICWCGRRDSNPHDFHHRNLNPARLPIPPRPPPAPPNSCGGPSHRFGSGSIAIRPAGREPKSAALDDLGDRIQKCIAWPSIVKRRSSRC